MKKNSLKILHLDSNHRVLLDQLADAGYNNDEDYESSKIEIESKIKDYIGIVIRSRFKIDKQFIDKAVNLKFIARVGAGLENIDCDYAKSKNIILIAAPEGNSNAVGEHTLGLLLSLLNKLNKADKQIREGKWIREGNRGFELENKTVGIIGYGHMGKSFAKKLRGFDVEVLCYDILENVGDCNAKQVSLVELQQKSDVLSLHIPFTESTNKMLNSDFINKFSKPFWLINTSRGKNVVTEDLVRALQSGKIIGAGLDVLEFEKTSFEDLFVSLEEPTVLNNLLKEENVILTPHIAGWTHESHEKLALTIANKIRMCFSDVAIPFILEKRVTGLGGFFFKSTNSKELIAWYQKHLGLKTDDYGSTFWWNDNDGKAASTQWAPFSSNSEYFLPSKKEFMINYRVHDLEKLVQTLRDEGVTIVGEIEIYEYGKFGWIIDPENNKIELWEPIDKVFL